MIHLKRVRTHQCFGLNVELEEELVLTGLSLASHWSLTGPSLVSHWSLPGLSLVSHWSLPGLIPGPSLVSLWSLSGLSLVSPWSLSGLSLVSHWSLTGLSLVSHWLFSLRGPSSSSSYSRSTLPSLQVAPEISQVRHLRSSNTQDSLTFWGKGALWEM